MVNSFPFILLVSTLLGFLSGLGIGGGSLLVLWLTWAANATPETARTVNLLFFLPAAIIACLFRRRQGTLKIRALIPAILSGCAVAAVCALLANRLDTQILRKLFGGLLVAAGIRELFYRPKKAR